MHMQQRPFLIFGIFIILAPFAFSGVMTTISDPTPKVQTGSLFMNYLLPFLFFVSAYCYWKLNSRSIRMSRGFYLSHLVISIALFLYISHLPTLIFKLSPATGMNFIESFPFAFALTLTFNAFYLLILFLALLLRKGEVQTL
jgi:hypothetical protein